MLKLSAQRTAWLQRLDRDPSPLLDYLRQSTDTRLGLYFERLWQFFLEQDPEVELLVHNLPVHDDGGRTLGEFDCIYFCRRRRSHVHLELAVKYYLGHRQDSLGAAPSQWSEWLGPNTADRLDLKVDQLMQRQIRLGDNPVAQGLLQAMGITELTREVAIKGYLFQAKGGSLPPPIGFNTDCALRHWTRVDSLEHPVASQHANRFLPLPRLRWLAPAQIEPGEDSLDSAELQASLASHFQAGGRPQLVAALDAAGCETDRFFVTGNNWPA